MDCNNTPNTEPDDDKKVGRKVAPALFTSTLITMSAPSARVTAARNNANNTPTPQLRASPPPPPTHPPGPVQLARIANGTSPSSFITTGSPVFNSVATAANGIGRSSN